MEVFLYGLPIPVALAAVAVLGYVLGRAQLAFSTAPAGQDSSRRELKRARAIVRDLEAIAQHIRRDLAQHHTNLVQFRSRIDQLAKQPESTNWKSLCDEAERLLQPTQDLARQLAQAYDGIRQQGNRLMDFTGQRCDPLTGLCNRQALDETLENYLAMHRRYGLSFSLVVLDLDEFKQINTDYGHLHGDRILQQVAEIIEQGARETDIVARLGGEEFIVVLPSSESAAASLFADRLRQAIHQLVQVTVSGGVATVAEGDDAKTLLTRADSALYAAKAAGRNRIFCHTGQNVLPCELDDEDEVDTELEFAAPVGAAE